MYVEKAKRDSKTSMELVGDIGEWDCIGFVRGLILLMPEMKDIASGADSGS